MARTLTIVARGPLYPYGSPTVVGDEEGDSAIQSIRNTLKSTANHIIERAVRVVDVKKHLDTHQPVAGDQVQLIGHGASGKLWLGGHWTGNEIENGRAVLLDSNHNLYGLLLDCVPVGCRVLLLGCSIGDSSRIADGPTLLFDLARMWRTEVCAPQGYVTAEDFGSDGTYQHEDRLVKASQLRIELASGLHVPLLPPVPAPTPTLVTIRKLLGAPMIGKYGLPPQPQLQPQLQQMTALVGREVDGSLLLAGAELQVEVSLDGQPVKGEIIGNLRLLRVRAAPRARYFELDPIQRKAMLAAVKSIVEKLRV